MGRDKLVGYRATVQLLVPAPEGAAEDSVSSMLGEIPRDVLADWSYLQDGNGGFEGPAILYREMPEDYAEGDFVGVPEASANGCVYEPTPEGWDFAHTGGGCTAFEMDLGGSGRFGRAIITAVDDPSVPLFGQPVTLGYYFEDSMGNAIDDGHAADYDTIQDAIDAFEEARRDRYTGITVRGAGLGCGLHDGKRCSCAPGAVELRETLDALDREAATATFVPPRRPWTDLAAEIADNLERGAPEGSRLALGEEEREVIRDTLERSL